MYKDKEKEKARHEKIKQESKLSYLAFMLLYPFTLEDLPGETWKWIKGYEELYQISNFGRLKSFTRKKPCIIKPGISAKGYLRFTLWRNRKSKHFSVHVLVAKTFIPNPHNLPEINHKDGFKFNNCVENLEWVTSSQNKQHAVKMGLRASGTNLYNSKLTEDDVRWIRANYILGDKEFGAKAIAEKFNMNPSTIQDVIHKRTYKNVE